MLTADELSRYKRHMILDNWGEAAQEKLKKSKVFVAGSGGLGSPLLSYITVAGVGNITVCDFDKIDLTNLNRQILHNDSRIGMEKVESAMKSLTTLNPNVNINQLNTKIEKVNVHDLISGHDLIIDCLDNFKGRHLLNLVSVSKNIPLLHAGVSKLQGQMSFFHPPETPCLACFLPAEDKKGENPIVGATAGVMGSLQAVEAIKFLTGINSNLKNKMLFWDGIEMRFESINISKNPKCKICS